MIFRKFITLILFSFISGVGSAQSFLWVDDPGGIGNDVGAAVASDANGNAYITGYYSGQCDFQGTFFFSNNGFEIYLAKYNPAGTLLWVKKAGGLLQDEGIDVIVGNDGMIYLTGLFRGTATFDAITLTSNGNADVFLASYDPSGNLRWVKSFGGNGEDKPAKLCMSNAGEILVTGTFSDSFVFDGSSHATLGYNDIFLCGFNQNGNPLWVKYYGEVNDEYVTGLLSRPATNDLWMSGYFYYDTQIGGTVLHSAGSSDIFLARLDSSGGAEWVIRSGGALAEVSTASCIGKDEETWLTGYFLGNAQFGSITLSDTGYNDIFLAKFDAQGQVVSAQKMGGTSLDVGTALAPGDSGSIYLTGSFSNSAKFGPIVRNAIGKDIFIAFVSDNGAVNWVLQAGGEWEDFSKGICRTSNQELLLTGYFYKYCWFGSNRAEAENSGIFLSRISTAAVSREAILPDFPLSVFPQPTQNRLFLRSDKALSSGHFTLFDPTGRRIWREDLANGMVNKELDVSHLSPGLYLLNLECDNAEKASFKILIQR